MLIKGIARRDRIALGVGLAQLALLAALLAACILLVLWAVGQDKAQLSAPF